MEKQNKLEKIALLASGTFAITGLSSGLASYVTENPIYMEIGAPAALLLTAVSYSISRYFRKEGK